MGGIIHPHKFYSERGGRQIAAPTEMCNILYILRTRNDDRYVENTEIRNKCIVGAAICRPPRIEYNLFG